METCDYSPCRDFFVLQNIPLKENCSVIILFMACCRLTKLLLKFNISLLTLFAHLQAKWGRLQMVPLAYRPPFEVKGYSSPTNATLIIITTLRTDPIISHDPSKNRFKAWVKISDPKRERIPKDFNGYVFLNKLKFDRRLRTNIFIRYYVSSQINPSQNYDESFFVSNLPHVPEFLRKPQVFDVTTSNGLRFRFILTTICDKDWYGISCDQYCTPGQTFNCSIMGGLDCHAGWRGSVCRTDINECDESKPCAHGGNCTNLPGSFSCTCPSTYKGATCEEDVNECEQDVSLCQNEGVCINKIGSFKCNCTQGFTGDTCIKDVDECLPKNPCENKGACQNLYGSFRCSCPVSYNGKLCEFLNPCVTDNPCKNGGLCASAKGSFKCTCSSPYTGTLCDDIDECVAHNPCKNGGLCVNAYKSFDCICPLAFKGKVCTDDVNECHFGNVCENEGNCTNLYGSFKCNCTSSFTGKLCTDKVHVKAPSIFRMFFSTATGIIITIVLFAIMVVCIVLLVIILILQKRKWQIVRKAGVMRCIDMRAETTMINEYKNEDEYENNSS